MKQKKNNTSVFTQAYVKKSQAKNNETIQIQNLAHSNWKFRKKGDAAWLPATVPGNVHTDLLNLGLIEDPFLHTNEEKVKWVENADWEYECVFMVSKENATKGNVELCLANLDTYGKVFLNNQLIAETNNQFRTWKYDVTKLIDTRKKHLVY
jgi:beta-mannosidase